MSIIYEALKKVEQSQNAAPDARIAEKTKTKKPALYKIYLTYCLAILGGLILANAFFWLIKPSSGPKFNFSFSGLLAKLPKPAAAALKDKAASPAPQPAWQPVSTAPVPAQTQQPAEANASLVLNGVFFSGEEGFALINNKVVKAGDTVDGATVKRIDINEVELETKSGPLKLSQNN